jgi:hypothetical protein
MIKETNLESNTATSTGVFFFTLYSAQMEASRAVVRLIMVLFKYSSGARDFRSLIVTALVPILAVTRLSSYVSKALDLKNF